MNVFYLNDIRKSFHMISLFFSLKDDNKFLIYNNKNDKYRKEYLDSLSNAFNQIRFLSLDDFLSNIKLDVNMFFYDLDYYSKGDIKNIFKIKTRKKILLLNNNIGVPVQENSSLNLLPNHFLVWNYDYISHLIKCRNSHINLNGSKTIYYRNHINKKSLIDHEQIKTLFFLPTKFSFRSENEISLFLKDLVKYLNKNSKDIFFKPHQRAVDNYLETSNFLINSLVYLFSFLSHSILDNLFRLINFHVLKKFLNYSKFKKIVRSQSFKSLKYPLIPIEFYLPYVRREIIGGFSNTLITASYYNLRSLIFGDKKIPKSIYKNGKYLKSDMYLFVNMEFFKNDNYGYEFRDRFFKKTDHSVYLNSNELLNI